MTAISVAQDVAVRVKLAPPAVLFSSTDLDAVELRSLLNECAQRIAFDRAWQGLSSLATLTGDGTTEAFDLPSDFGWMRQDQQIWSSSLQAPFYRVKSQDEWLGLDIRDFDVIMNAWVILGNQVLVKPALDTGVTAKFYYQSKNIVTGDSGVQTTFTADDDTFRLDERLLKLCMIWQYKEANGIPYAEDMATYEEALAQAETRDGGPRVIKIGRPRWPRGACLAYPQSIVE